MNPEIIIDEAEHNLEEFRDLFYQPHNPYSEDDHSNEFWRVGDDSEGSRPVSGSSTLWNVLSPVLGHEFDGESGRIPRSVGSQEQERALSGYSDGANRYRAASEDGQ